MSFKENEKLHRKIIELEKLCDQDKDQAEVKDVEQEKTDEDDEDEDEDQEQDPDEVNDDDGNEKMKKIRKKLKETEEELEYAEAHNHKLIAKESELEEARKELISGWDSASRAFIGVKRMGELESKPFQTACKRKYPMDEADDQAAALCSLWESYLRDSCWKPFKTIRVAFRQQPKITIDEGDEKLKKLKDEFGDEVYNAVTTALLESKEYNSRHHWREESIIKRGCLVFTEAVETAEKEKIKLKALRKEDGVLKELWLLSRVNWLLLNNEKATSMQKKADKNLLWLAEHMREGETKQVLQKQLDVKQSLELETKTSERFESLRCLKVRIKWIVAMVTNRPKNTHPLCEHHEKALLEEDKALTEFDAQCKDIKKELEPSEAPKKELSKELEQSGDQKKKLEKKTQLQKQLPQMGDETRGGSNEPATELDASTAYFSEDKLAEGNGKNLIPEPIPSQTPEEAAVPEQATISEEDRLLLQLSSTKQLLQLRDEPQASNAAELAKQTLRTWLSRDLETISPHENFGELKEALEVLHAQNLLPEELLRMLRKMFIGHFGFDAHIAEKIKEKQELHEYTRFLTDHEQDLAKIKHGVEICQACEAELEEYDLKLGRVKAELAALEQGRAGLIKKFRE
ncbi:XH/XS domain-containing protein [Prunus dulcis]|uniref:XH/XS domain-containing protein n=1 Tax=Prunus dulcis TaxID=3755 RepID=A0A4Y1RL05_PRUDU|nr:XH/XS domain-containing protein [Prunus dulcis]